MCRDAATRRSLCYAYVNYTTAADAANAMKELNYTLLRDKPMRVMVSQRDPTLRRQATGNVFIKSLPPSVDVKTLHTSCSEFGAIKSCRVAVDNAGVSRGHAFVQFETEEAAAACIKSMHGMDWDGRTIYAAPFEKSADRGKDSWTNVRCVW